MLTLEELMAAARRAKVVDGPAKPAPAPFDRKTEFRLDAIASVPITRRWALEEASWKRHRVRYGVDVDAAQRAGAAQGCRIITLFGASGGGKTSTAVRLFGERLTRVKWPIGFFVKPSTLVREQREGRTERGSYPLLARARSTRILVLDDLGVEMEGKWAQDVVETIHDRVDDPKVQTIVTTELDEARIVKRYGSGIGRRLFEEAAIEFRGQR